MAGGTDEDLRVEPVDEWVEALKSRTVELQKKEKERSESQPAIFRVHPSLRELRQEHFDVSTVSLGLVSKIERPTHVTDTLKSDVAIKFLDDTGKSADDWRNITENVVLDPEAMKRLYNDFCRSSEDNIRFILTEDAIFLACFLIYFFRSLPQTLLQKTCNFFSRQSRRLRLVIFKDICKLENQIPLELVRNVIVIVFRCQGPDLLEKECQDKANEALEKICSKFVSTLSIRFPSFQSPKTQVPLDTAKQADSTKNATGNTPNGHIDSEAKKTQTADMQTEQTLETVGQARETIYSRSIGFMLKQFRFRKSGYADSQGPETLTTNIAALQFHRCQHLLHCLAEVFWNAAKVSDSKNQSRRQSLWDQHLPTAKELHRYGVKLQGHKGFHPKLVRDRFFPRRATLFLPSVGAVDDDTEEVWRNLLAFEDAYMKQDERRSFMSYLQFMTDLISTEEDVRLLFTGKNPVIIASDIGDHKAVADMYNRVTKNHFRACNAEWSLVRREVTKCYESSQNWCTLVQPTYRENFQTH